MAAALIPWTLFQVWAEHLRARERWVGYGLLQSSVLLGAAAVFMVLIPESQADSPSLYVFTIVSAVMLFWLPSFLRGDRRVPGVVSLRQSLGVLRPLRSTATSMFLTGTLFMIMTWSDTLMVGYFLDAESVGFYRVAFKIATLITFAQFAVNAQIAPQISAAWKAKDLQGLQASVHRVALLNAALGLPAFIVLTGWGDFFLSFFSENSSEILAQTDLLRILCIGQIVNALCGPVMYLLNMTGHESSARNTMTLAVVVNILANAALIPTLDLEGAAWATTLTMSLWNLWALVAVYRKTGIRTLLFWR
jgi:O-antigen/teichoic acid export membrane protein